MHMVNACVHLECVSAESPGSGSSSAGRVVQDQSMVFSVSVRCLFYTVLSLVYK